MTLKVFVQLLLIGASRKINQKFSHWLWKFRRCRSLQTCSVLTRSEGAAEFSFPGRGAGRKKLPTKLHRTGNRAPIFLVCACVCVQNLSSTWQRCVSISHPHFMGGRGNSSFVRSEIARLSPSFLLIPSPSRTFALSSSVNPGRLNFVQGPSSLPRKFITPSSVCFADRLLSSSVVWSRLFSYSIYKRLPTASSIKLAVNEN
jgi:hypothetical protein